MLDDAFRYVASQGRYHSWCRACERAARASSPRRARRTSSRQGRAFGVEIELTGPSQRIIADALLRIGIDVRTRGYAATNGNDWELKTDGSVRGHGLELVSPKLYGDAGIETLKNVLAALNMFGATVDRSCGIHVHIDFRDRDLATIKNAILPIVGSQSAIYDMCAPSRRTNAYSPMWRDHDIDSLRASYRLQYISGVGPRGFVNLGSYPRHGSIEFRSHGGSTNAGKIVAWVHMIQAAVAYGEANPGTESLGATAPEVCATLNLSDDDTRALCRFVNAAAALEASEYAGV
jgi:hypothetical protein